MISPFWKKVFTLLGRGKHPLGPSVTASCLSGVQDGLHRHTHAAITPLQCELGKPACLMWCSKASCLPTVVGVNPTLNSPLFPEFVIPLGAALEGKTCCHNTGSEVRRWPFTSQSKALNWPMQRLNGYATRKLKSQSVTQPSVQSPAHEFARLARFFFTE